MKNSFDPVRDIKEFHQKYGLDYQGPPRTLDMDTSTFRNHFMEEELEEWAESGRQARVYQLANGSERLESLEDQLDALVDLMYVLMGTALLQGFLSDGRFEEAWRRVHEANMKKVRASSAIESKRGSSLDVIKPEGWVAPRHDDLVKP